MPIGMHYDEIIVIFMNILLLSRFTSYFVAWYTKDTLEYMQSQVARIVLEFW